jgi:hypothetical protein
MTYDASHNMLVINEGVWGTSSGVTASGNTTTTLYSPPPPPTGWEEVTVVVYPKPTASLITTSPKTVCQYLENQSVSIGITKRIDQAVTITSSSTGDALVTVPTSLAGNYIFADSTAENCGQKTYTLVLPINTDVAGTQTISITGLNDGCPSETLSLSLTINVIEAPTIAFVYDPICFGETIPVNITANTDGLDVSAEVYVNNACDAGWVLQGLGTITDNSDGTYSSTLTLPAPGTWTIHANSVTAGTCTNTNPVQVTE